MNHRRTGIGFGGEGSVVRRDIYRWHRARLQIPCERKIITGAPPTRGIDLSQRVRAARGFGGIAVEPAMIETRLVELVCAGEMPVAIPNLNPRMIAILVRPFRNSDDSRGHTDGAAGIRQNNGQPGARS